MSGAALGTGCAVVAVAWLISIPLEALALSLTWNWFVVRVFDSLPTIGIIPAIGLRLFLATIWRPHDDGRETSEERDPDELASRMWSTALAKLAVPAGIIAIAFGWHAFVEM